MGRVVLDIIKSGTPVGILGYGGFINFLTPQNLEKFAKTNLTSWEVFSGNNITALFQDTQNHPSKYLFKASDLNLFNNQLNYEKHYTSLGQTSFNNKPIITKLNYFFDNNTAPHNILSELTLSNDLQFDIIYNFLNNHLIEDVSMSNENATLRDELSKITTSKFWKATKPIRQLLQKLHTA